jgi:1-acyl-sn-glycerol-3-phosphate acyltransferase
MLGFLQISPDINLSRASSRVQLTRVLVNSRVGVRPGDARHDNGALSLSTRKEAGVSMTTISSQPLGQQAKLDGAPPRTAPERNGALPRATAPDRGNGRAPLDPGVAAKPGSAERQSKGGIEGLIGKRVAAATEHALDGPNQTLMRVQKPVWDVLCKYYFRLETSGWQRLPEETSILIGNHSGGSLTMDAWTFVYAWWRRFGTERVLHATAHDVLMATPGLGDYFRKAGVIPASRQGVSAALSAGCDVVIWPGGEVDAMRNWRRRDEAVLGGRMGFVRTAIRSGVPIVPVASVGGHDTAFVLSEGRWIANGLDRISGLKKKLRGSRLPIVLGFPFGLTIETIPTHLPLPAKIRTELLDPIHVDDDPDRVNDREYVESIYHEVESAIQAGMDRLAKQRRFPIFA